MSLPSLQGYDGLLPYLLNHGKTFTQPLINFLFESRLDINVSFELKGKVRGTRASSNVAAQVSDRWSIVRDTPPVPTQRFTLIGYLLDAMIHGIRGECQPASITEILKHPGFDVTLDCREVPSLREWNH